MAGMLTFAFFAVPPQYLTDFWTRVGFGALAVLCAIGAAYEWWVRKDDGPHVSASSPQPSVLPVIRAINPQVRQAHKDPKDGRVRLGLGPVSTTLTMRHALLALFRNEPAPGRPTRKAHNVTALVTFGNPRDRASGYWLESYSRAMDLEEGEEAAVVLAFVVDEEHAELVNIGPDDGVTFWTCPQRRNCPREEFAMSVRLLEAGHCVTEAEYKVRLSSGPPDVVLLGQSTEAGVKRLDQSDDDERKWSIRFNGNVADVKVVSEEIARYAVALDVTIVNREDHAVTLTADLAIQWGSLHALRHAVGLPLPQWENFVRAFGFGQRRQLIFPLTIAAGETVSGHVLFSIQDEGEGVAMIGISSVSDPAATDETERHDRSNYVRFEEPATFARSEEDVHSVYAPAMDGSGIAVRSDIAVAGRPAIWTLR